MSRFGGWGKQGLAILAQVTQVPGSLSADWGRAHHRGIRWQIGGVLGCRVCRLTAGELRVTRTCSFRSWALPRPSPLTRFHDIHPVTGFSYLPGQDSTVILDGAGEKAKIEVGGYSLLHISANKRLNTSKWVSLLCRRDVRASETALTHPLLSTRRIFKSLLPLQPCGKESTYQAYKYTDCRLQGWL